MATALVPPRANSCATARPDRRPSLKEGWCARSVHHPSPAVTLTLTGGTMDQALRSGHRDQAVDPLLILTDTAVEMLKQALKQKGMKVGGIRMTVTGGGCKGFQYSLTLDEAAHTDDEVVVQDGVTAFLDPVSARHLRGTQLDYVSNRHGTGFHFFGLDAARTIGCGSPALLRRCIAGNIRTTGCINSAKRPLLEVGQMVAPPTVEVRTSVAHPGLRPRSICTTCHYVVCRCEEQPAPASLG